LGKWPLWMKVCAAVAIVVFLASPLGLRQFLPSAQKQLSFTSYATTMRQDPHFKTFADSGLTLIARQACGWREFYPRKEDAFQEEVGVLLDAFPDKTRQHVTTLVEAMVAYYCPGRMPPGRHFHA
jgi:hypothetical protein